VRHYCELLFLASLSISTCERSFICTIIKSRPPLQIRDCFRFHSGGGCAHSAATLDNFPKSFAPLETWDNPHVTAGRHLHTLQHSDLAFTPVSLPDSYFPPPYFIHRSGLHRARWIPYTVAHTRSCKVHGDMYARERINAKRIKERTFNVASATDTFWGPACLPTLREHFFKWVTWILTASVKSILNQYHKRINLLEGEKYDLEYEVARKDMEVEKLFSWQTERWARALSD